jgi:uncharacterized protein (TIGR03000 family)
MSKHRFLLAAVAAFALVLARPGAGPAQHRGGVRVGAVHVGGVRVGGVHVGGVRVGGVYASGVYAGGAVRVGGVYVGGAVRVGGYYPAYSGRYPLRVAPVVVVRPRPVVVVNPYYGVVNPYYGVVNPYYGAVSPYYGYAPSYSYSPNSYEYVAPPVVAYNPPSAVAQSNSYAPLPVAPAEVAPNACLIDVRLPAEAELWFEGDRVNEAGALRRFVSPALEPGKVCTYAVRARWVQDGRPIDRVQAVQVQAGGRVTVDFLSPGNP